MKRITVSLSTQTASWVRKQAASRGISVSRFVADLLQGQAARDSREYRLAMDSFLSRGPFKVLTGAPEGYPKRDELYDRPRRFQS